MISGKLKDIIIYVADYVDNTTDDWFTIKRELVNNFPPKERKRFSRRHYSTKKHVLNKFDRKVIKFWEETTSTKLIIDEEKLHSKDWVQKPRGHGLKKFNEERRHKKITTPN